MILIAGGNGFVGQHVARYLLAEGEQVIVTCHSRGGVPILLADDVGKGRAFVEPVNLTDAFAVMGVIAKYQPRVVIDLSGHRPKAQAAGPYAEDGYDQIYVNDAARGIGLIALVTGLRHAAYKIGSGGVTTYGAFADAVAAVMPTFHPTLRWRAREEFPEPPSTMDGRWMAPARARTELRFEPRFGVEAAMADYVEWMRALPC